MLFIKSFTIHIYTYHQIYHILKDTKTNGNNRFSLSNYKYIVFDECHFFTSDSRFVNTTDDMLKLILEEGKQFIRIYMSATPEVVFEPIIRMEYAWINDIKSYYINNVRRIFSDFRGHQSVSHEMLQLLGCDYWGGTEKRTLSMTSETYRELLEEDAHPTSKPSIYLSILSKGDLPELQQREDGYFNQIKSDYRLNIYFYYIERNYDYIHDIKTYKDISELYGEINANESPHNKWMAFVPSRKFGTKLRDMLNGVPSDSDNNDDTGTEDELSTNMDDDNESVEEGQDTGRAIFISAQNRNTELEAKETYNDIVRNEHFEQDILITTSVLDNGINIKDENVRNIAIGIYDRVEFLQMLGRLRIENKDCKINLYAQEYDVDNLKKYVENAAKNLIYRLMSDVYGSERKELYKFMERRKNYKLDRDLYRFSDDPDVFCEYNRCSVYQIIDYLSNLITIIRKTEKDFCVHLKNDDDELLRGKIVKYYTRGNGRNAEWSRSIVDILGSKDDMENRNKGENDALSHGIVPPQYQYTLQDTFIRYLYYDVIPCYINEQIKKELERFYFNTLPSEKINNKNSVKESEYTRFNALCHRHQLTEPDSLCPYFRAWKDMYEGFSVDDQKWYAPLMEKVEKLAERINQYRKLANDIVANPTDAQYRWIGQLKTTEEEDVISNRQNIEDWIRNANIPTVEELEAVKQGNYYEENFLINHSGIPIDTEEPTQQETEFSKKYLKGKPLKAYREKMWKVDGEDYEFTSRPSTGSRTTYYLFVKKSANPIQQVENCESPSNVS